MTEIPIMEGAIALLGSGGLAGAGWFLKDLHTRLNGPALDARGSLRADRVRERAGRRADNHDAVLRKAILDAGDELNEAGEVHPRVVDAVLSEAEKADDPVMQAYLAGLLRSGRSTTSDPDDRAAFYAKIIGSLTSNQIRLHHAVYSVIARVPRPDDVDLTNGPHARAWSVFANLRDAAGVLHIHSGDDPGHVVTETAVTLTSQGLTSGWRIQKQGGQDDSEDLIEFSAGELGVTSSVLGCLTFLRAHGVASPDGDLLGRIDRPVLSPQAPQFALASVGPWE